MGANEFINKTSLNVFSGTLKTIYNAFTLPSIGLPVSTVDNNEVISALTKWGLMRGIPIAAYQIEEVGRNQLGQQIVLRANKEGNNAITDNITPLPRQWRIRGYISVEMYTAVDLTRSVSVLHKLQTKTVFPTILKFVKSYFEYLRNSRAPFYFTTPDGTTVQVVMDNKTLTDVAEVQNSTAIDLSLTEFISLSLDGSSALEESNKPKEGGLFADPASLGNFAVKAVTTGVAALSGLMQL